MSDVVLVVAGDPLFAKGIERAFQKAGLEVVLADEAETALVALEFEKPAAVVVENDLRDKPGSHLARDIRARDEGNGIPLVLLAGAMMPAAELAPRVFSAGVTACIDSTVDPDLLAEAMKLRLGGDADALGRLARGEFSLGGGSAAEEEAEPNPAEENTELDDAAEAEASLAEARALTGAPVGSEDPAPEGASSAASADGLGIEVDVVVPPAAPEPKPEKKVYPPAKPRSGSLGDLAFGELLAELYLEHASGVLDLSREKVKKSIWLKEGIPTYAKSNAMGETLGAVLVKMGKITEAQRAASMEISQKDKKKHGDVLVEMGVIRPKDVVTALQAQARAKVINCFAWDDGVYRFVPTDELPDDMPSLKMTFGALVAAGVKQRYDLPRLRKVLLPHIGETPRYQEAMAGILDEMKIDGPEREVVAAMRGRRSLAEVLALSDMDEEELHRLLVSTYFAGLVRFYPEGPMTMQMRLGRDELVEAASLSERAPRSEPTEDSREEIAPAKGRAHPEEEEEPEDDTELVGRASRASASEPTLADDESEEIELPDPEPPSSSSSAIAADDDDDDKTEPPGPAARMTDDGDDAEPLAPPAVIADEAPMPEKTEAPVPRTRTRTVEDELKSFVDRDAGSSSPSTPPVRESSARRRNRFDDVDDRPAAGEVTAPPAADPAVMRKIDAALAKMETQNFYERLGVAVGTAEGLVKSAYLKLAKEYHPDRLVTEGGAGVKEKADQLFALISEAYHTLTDAGKRKKYDDEVIHGKMSDEAASDEAEAILNAEHQFLKGERLLKAGNFQKAFEAFKAAVDLYPKESEYQACYGYCLFRVNHPANAAKAAEGEKILKSALQMNPRNDKAHYFIGAVAKTKGDNDAAKQSFEKALALNPDNVDAQRELRVMDMRDSKNKGISGIFSRKK